MGDARFSPLYASIRDDPNRVAAIRRLSDEDVTAALAAASREADPLIANFLATEAMNRILLGRSILESITDAVIALDREGRITFMNAAAEAMLGQLREEHLGHAIVEFTMTAEKDIGLHARLMSPMRDGGSREHDDVLFRTRDDRTIAAHVSAAPLMVHDAIRGVVLVIKPRSALGAEPPRLSTASGRS